MPAWSSVARSRGRPGALTVTAGSAPGAPFHLGKSDSRFRIWIFHTSLYVNSLKASSPARAMLHSMQQTDANPLATSDRSSSSGWSNLPSSAPASFAGLLASLTAPVPKTAWNNDDLAEDVATLSYEHALRAHSRYTPADPIDWTIPQAAGSIGDQTNDSPSGDSALPPQTAALWAAPGWGEETRPESAESFSATLEQNKKCASITIRLSKTECDQLRRRASQAGLTVSAYLRSCTFEAEVLRAQVKDVLAELRTATVPVEQGSAPTPLRSWFKRFLRFIPRWHSSQRVARA